MEGLVPVFISHRNRVAQLYPRALSALSVASYDSQGYGAGILTLLHTGFLIIASKSLVCFIPSVVPKRKFGKHVPAATIASNEGRNVGSIMFYSTSHNKPRTY
jgi:hypothetical protein